MTRGKHHPANENGDRAHDAETRGDEPRGVESQAVEIHGYVGCAFAWRVRLVAAEKNIPFAWIPCDVEKPDARAAAHNPFEHSPLLHHRDVSLRESEAIAAYLDEGFPGRPLWPADLRERALLRMLSFQLRALDVHTERNELEARRRMAPPLALLESALATGDLDEGRVFAGGGRDHLHGEAPGFVDLMLLPFLFHSQARGFIEPREAPAVARYLARVAARPSYEATRTPWARKA